MTDSFGRLIYVIQTEKEITEIKVDQFQRGIYFLKCEIGTETTTLPIILN